MQLTLQLHAADNVAVARTELLPNVLLPELNGLAVADNIPRYHKLATRPIAKNDLIIKYDQVIGIASQDIKPGQHVHSHNCFLPTEGLPKRSAGEKSQRVAVGDNKLPSEFMGYPRSDGQTGTRNYVGILTSVNCSATVAKLIEQHFAQPGVLSAYDNVDGVVAFTPRHRLRYGYGGGIRFVKSCLRRLRSPAQLCLCFDDWFGLRGDATGSV